MNTHKLPFNSRNLLKRVGTQKTTREYQNRQAIYSQGDGADAIFHIQNGRVKLVVASPRGKQAVIAILGPGDVIAMPKPGLGKKLPG
jgi:CRP-like cAMP-binding protein